MLTLERCHHYFFKSSNEQNVSKITIQSRMKIIRKSDAILLCVCVTEIIFILCLKNWNKLESKKNDSNQPTVTWDWTFKWWNNTHTHLAQFKMAQQQQQQQKGFFRLFSQTAERRKKNYKFE